MSNRYFFRLRCLVAAVGLLALSGLSGCAVYAPTVPSTPLVQKGQAEITAGIRGLTALEANAAWSPAEHVFFNVEGAASGYKVTQTNSTGTTTENDNYNRQGSVGMGVYTLTKAPQPLYLAAVAGFGLAAVDIRPVDLFGFARYEGNYRRYYGQVYLAQPGERVSWGVSARATWVDYGGLLQDGDPLVVSNRWFAEPHAFVRVGGGPVQGYATLGLSVPVARAADAPGFTGGVFSPTSGLVGLGVVFRPHLLRRADR